MRITLNQKEIEAGLQLYLVAAGIALAGKAIDIKFTASRGEEGMTAAVDIDEAPAVPEKTTPVLVSTDAPTKSTKTVKAIAAVKEDAPPAPPPAAAPAEAGEPAAEAGTPPAEAPKSLFA